MGKESEEGNSKYTMVCTGGMFLMGVLVGGNKLLKPRVFTLLEEEVDPGKKEKGTRVKLQPLPCIPPFANVKPDFTYPVPNWDKELIALYERVTTRKTPADKPAIPVEPSPVPGGKVIMEP
jgi:hypothetical protein